MSSNLEEFSDESNIEYISDVYIVSQIKLVTGEVIIASVKYLENEIGYDVQDPLELKTNPYYCQETQMLSYGIVLYPWFPVASTQSMFIKEEHIVCIVDISEEILQSYLENIQSDKYVARYGLQNEYDEDYNIDDTSEEFYEDISPADQKRMKFHEQAKKDLKSNLTKEEKLSNTKSMLDKLYKSNDV